MQYKICFDLEMPDDCTDAVEDALAAKLVRLVYEHLLLGLSLEQQKQELLFVRALKTVRASAARRAVSDSRVGDMLRALEQEAKFQITFRKMVDELKPLQPTTSGSAADRQPGHPGRTVLDLLRQGVLPSRGERCARASIRAKRSTLARAAVDDIVSGRLSTDAGRWIEQHQADVIVAVAVIVVLTAAVLVIVATGGAGALLAVPVAETALVEAGVLAGQEALIASASTAVAVDSTVVVVGAAGATGVSGGGAAVGSSVGVALAVEGGGLAQGQLIALRFGIGMCQAQAAAALLARHKPLIRPQ